MPTLNEAIVRQQINSKLVTNYSKNITAEIHNDLMNLIVDFLLVLFQQDPAFKGAWNASTNNPALTITPSAANDFYVVTVAGTQSVTGSSIAYAVGDQLRSNGTEWVRIPFALPDGSVALAKLEATLSAYVTFLQSVITKNSRYFWAITDELGYPDVFYDENGLFFIAQKLVAKVINGVEFTGIKDYFTALIDEKGYRGFSVDFDAKLYAKEVMSDLYKIGTSSIGLVSTSTGSVAFVNNVTGAVLFEIDPTGIISPQGIKFLVNERTIYPISYTDSNGYPKNAMLSDGTWLSDIVDSPELGLTADINHLLVYSQSLGFGGSTGMALTTSPVDSNILMFAGGVHTGAGIDRSSFTPLYESGLESPMGGMAIALKQLLGATLSSSCQLLFSCPGVANTSVVNLSKGTDPYAQLLLDIQSAKALANAAGKTYKVVGVFWVQGEADALNASYQTQFTQLQYDVNTDIKSTVGQKDAPPWVMYQTASFNAYSAGVPPTAAYQQLSTVNDASVKRTYMSTPMYQYTYGSDNVHLTPQASRKFGIDNGKYFYDVIFNNPAETHIRLTKTFVQGNIIELTFAAPQLPLAFASGSEITDPGNKGFRLWTTADSTKTEITISSVTIVGGNRVRIVAASTVTRGMYLTYAVNGTSGKSGSTQGMRGCLRDSQVTAINLSGTDVYVYNYCPIFDLLIS